jgi:hypothetical protein
MHSTGERVLQPGVYTSHCCSYEDALAEAQEFPVCGTCARPTQWARVTPGEASPDDPARRVA